MREHLFYTYFQQYFIRLQPFSFKAFVMWGLRVGYVGVESRTDQLIFIAGLVFWQIRCSDFLQHLWGYVSHEDDEQGGRESLDGCSSWRVKKTLLDNQPMGATPMMMLRRNLHWEKQFPSKDCVLRHYRKSVQWNIRVGVSLIFKSKKFSEPTCFCFRDLSHITERKCSNKIWCACC